MINNLFTRSLQRFEVWVLIISLIYAFLKFKSIVLMNIRRICERKVFVRLTNLIKFFHFYQMLICIFLLYSLFFIDNLHLRSFQKLKILSLLLLQRISNTFSLGVHLHKIRNILQVLVFFQSKLRVQLVV